MNKFLIALALLASALTTPAWSARYELDGTNDAFYVAKTGNDATNCQQATPCLTIGRAVAVICGSVDVRGNAPAIVLSPGVYNETVSVSGYCELFLYGATTDPTIVTVTGLMVRDYAVVLFYNLSVTWVLQAQNSIIDAANFNIVPGTTPTGFQISLEDNSKFNAGAYNIIGGATAGHVYVGHASRFSQSGSVTVNLGPWLSLGTFFRVQWGGLVDIGPGVVYVNRDQVTAIPFELSQRGMLSTGNNIFPGSKYWCGNVGDGLLVGSAVCKF